LYPQPATSSVIMELNSVQLLNTEATLADNQGRALRQIKLTQPRQAIDISSLKPGMYYLRLADGKALKLIKVD
jgi:hypothetical protein